MKYVLYALLFWFLYQFIFKLVIPVYRTTRKLKKGFKEMQERMNDQQQQQQNGWPPSSSGGKSSTAAPKPSKGDYIDFEEISFNN